MPEYDIVVVGGGSGSQVATAGARRGLDTAVIEPGPLGGACITSGCVPSKALIHRADLADDVRRADRFGVEATLETVDYDALTSSIHEFVYEKADHQERSLDEASNVTLYRGEGRFVGDRTLELDPNEDATDPGEIRADHVVVAVGSRPVVAPIDGIDDVDFLTSDDALFLDDQPDELVIVGGGYIGTELGYFFGAIGTDVSIVGRSDRLVPGEDDAASEVVTAALETHCDCYTGHEAAAVDEEGNRVTVVAESVDEEDGDETIELTGNEVLLATGRRPNTDTLDPGESDIETDDAGHIRVDDTLETTAQQVWALGDVLTEKPFKHAADYEAEIVSANLIDGADRTVDYDAIPHAVFTSPRVASVGETEAELAEGDVEYESTRVGYEAAPKGHILDAEEGFVKVLSAPDGEILGCHIVGPEAPSLIHEVVVAMERGSGTVDDVAETVHIHPALNEVVLKAFDTAADRAYSAAPDWRDVGKK